MNIFISTPRRRRSHGHRHYTSPTSHDVSFNDLLPFIQKPLGIHHIRKKFIPYPFQNFILCSSYVWKPLLQALIQTYTNLQL